MDERDYQPRMKLIIPYDFQKFDIPQECWDKAFDALADGCDVVLSCADKKPYKDPATVQMFATSVVETLASSGCFKEASSWYDYLSISASHKSGTELHVF